jgi:PAS domain S-box-containing protein
VLRRGDSHVNATVPTHSATRIAIVDDSPELVEVMGAILTDDGYDVVVCLDRDDVVAELAAAQPDLIILDLLLRTPGTSRSGWDLLQQIRTNEGLRGVPVLICSADLVTLRERAEEISRQRATDSLAKPFSIQQLEDAVARLLVAKPVPAWDDERDLVLIADRSGRLIRASAAALEMLGYQSVELTARSVRDVVAEDPSWTEREWERYVADGSWTGPVTLRTANGDHVPARQRTPRSSTLGRRPGTSRRFSWAARSLSSRMAVAKPFSSHEG